MKKFKINSIGIYTLVFFSIIFIFIALKENNMSNIPSGSIMFFNRVRCPDGWEEFKDARGRYVVGLVESGTLAATVGIALSDKENRPVGKHSHTINDPGHSHELVTLGHFDGSIKGILPGSSKTSNIENITPAKTNITINESGLVEGTNAPYIQLLVCQKQ